MAGVFETFAVGRTIKDEFDLVETKKKTKSFFVVGYKRFCVNFLALVQLLQASTLGEFALTILVLSETPNI